MSYNNTQPGTITITIAIFMAVYFVVLYTLNQLPPQFFILITVIIIIVLGFATLNIRIDNQFIRIKFGYGIFRKKFKLSEIKKATIEKSKWYVGWGIRYDWPNKCWVYNISGYDVIEITEKSGKKYRLGTNDPKNLHRAISQRLNNS